MGSACRRRLGCSSVIFENKGMQVLELSRVIVRGEGALGSAKGCLAWREAWCSSLCCSPKSIQVLQLACIAHAIGRIVFSVVLAVKDRANIYIILVSDF